MVIMENHISGGKADEVIKKLGFTFLHRVEAIRHLGGI